MDHSYHLTNLKGFGLKHWMNGEKFVRYLRLADSAPYDLSNSIPNECRPTWAILGEP